MLPQLRKCYEFVTTKQQKGVFRFARNESKMARNVNDWSLLFEGFEKGGAAKFLAFKHIPIDHAIRVLARPKSLHFFPSERHQREVDLLIIANHYLVTTS